MAAGDQIKPPSNAAKTRAVRTGTYTAYAKSDGRVIYTKENFLEHHDKVPMGISMTMGAAHLVDPKSGEVLFAWDPWDILKKK